MLVSIEDLGRTALVRTCALLVERSSSVLPMNPSIGGPNQDQHLFVRCRFLHVGSHPRARQGYRLSDYLPDLKAQQVVMVECAGKNYM